MAGATEAESPAEAGARGKSRPSRLLIAFLLAAPLALAAVAGGGLYMLEAETTEVATAPPPPPEPLQFLKIEAVSAPLRRLDGTVAIFTVEVSLDLTGGAGAVTQARSQIPRLRDAFILALGQPPLRARAADNRASLEEVKSRLLAASRAVLGADAVRDVLIVSSTG